MHNSSRLFRLAPNREDELADFSTDDRAVAAGVHRGGLEASRPTQRRIGAIMIDLGMLDIDRAERVLEVQRDSGGRFGDIAVSLGYLRDPQVALALARQRGTPTLLPEDRARLSEQLRAVIDDPKSLRAYSDARTQLELRWFDDSPERRLLAVVSDSHADGRTISTATLGLLLAMTGRKVLLVDACVESPTLAPHFGPMDSGLSLGDAMNSPARLEHLQPALGSLDLAILSPQAAELDADAVASRAFASLLGVAASYWDAVLVDTPAWSDNRNALALAVRCSGVVILARLGQTRLSKLGSMRRHLADAGVEIIGSIAQQF